MRITGGELRSRSLVAPRGQATRPTSDRVREALFSILHARTADPYGPAVLDLYAGTGALALEALSRGAPRAILVEHARPALGALRANVEALGLGPRVEILASRVEQAVPKLRGPFGVIFCDPPYAQVSAPETWALLAVASRWLAPDGVLVLEHAPSDVPREIPGLPLEVTRAYGDTALSLFVASSPEVPQDGG